MIQVPNDTKFDKAVEVSQKRVKQLERFTNAAREYQKRGDTHRVALCVNTIYRDKLFLEAGTANIYDYCKNRLNIGHGTVVNYTSVAKKFLDSGTGKSIFAEGETDFSFIALIELKSLPADEVKELIANGVISVSSTASECKAAVAEYKARKKEAVRRAKESNIEPIKNAYEDFHKAYNELKALIPDNEQTSGIMQRIMDSVVILYNENDRLWS